MVRSLSPQAVQVIDQYLHFSVGNSTISIPYFNNKRAKIRAGLRVLIGKGSPEEIAEEIEIICLKNKINKTTLTAGEPKQLLVNNTIGIDCSGFVYYVLNAESIARENGVLKKKLHFPKTTNIVRALIRRWRIIENINVALLADSTNSTLIELKDTAPGDMIIIMDAGYAGSVDHVMLVSAVEYDQERPTVLHLTHSFQWTSDGKYNHGVREAVIDILDINKPLIAQKWIEQGKTGTENETLKRAKEAKHIGLRRLLALA